MNLEVELAGYGVLPSNGESLDELLLPRRKVVDGNLLALRLHTESRRASLSSTDRDVGVGEVPDFRPDGKRFVLSGENVEHDLAGNDCGT